MGFIQLNFRPEVRPEDHYRLEQALSNVMTGDKVDIVVESSDAHQTDLLMNTLHQNGFDYQPKGGQGQTYHILAWRRPN